MIDSHCHLAGAEFVADLEAVVARARDAGVERCLVVLAADDDAEVERAARVSSVWPRVRFAVGVHPHQAHRFAGAAEQAADLTARRLDGLTGACAVGEIGLDYYYDFSPKAVQQAVFRAQLRLARARDLPVVIHTREADADTLAIVAEEAAGRLRGVFHCFTGSPAAASAALGTGFHVSIPGIVTFPKASELREAVAGIPDDRLLIETDSPYLAPVPHRGSRNEPARVMQVFERVVDLRKADRQALGATLVRNFDALFGEPIEG
jgi:TatD DNase family protein